MRRLEDFPDVALRIFERPRLPGPADVGNVYLIGICGKGMGALAELFAQAKYKVRGSDAAAYPPMSTRLESLGIPVDEGYDAAHLEPTPDLVIVGNACTPTHVEAAYAREDRLAQASFPEALAHYFLNDRRPVVVAGTHGKTTTTGLAVHVFKQAGLDPGFLVGGVIVGEEATSAVGSGSHFIIEGDEYDSAYFDKRPKMWLYRPQVAIVTSMEFDHADIYDDWDDYRQAFQTFVRLIPQDGLLVLNGDDPVVRSLANETRTDTLFVGHDANNDVTAQHVRVEEGGQGFEIVADGFEPFEVFFPMGGDHNRFNALAVAAVALREGISPAQLSAGLASFQGIKRRQEVRGEVNGVLVVDDFAHHPTAVKGTIQAVRERWPGRRLVAVFEPRSNSSRRKLFELQYGKAFDNADQVFISSPPLRHNDDPADFLDPHVVAEIVLKRGTIAEAYEGADSLLPHLIKSVQAGDLLLVMSNGSFDGLVDKLMARLPTIENL